ncbi:hypothetical protein MUP77_09370 [Candidatus Bathyarchaeota archaeon]|nr:hypothetical protein [Candidatus Bathyarchaeota archaeon]
MVLESPKNVLSEALKTSSKREEYLSAIDRVLEMAFEKLENRYTKNPERLAWARIAVSCCISGSSILNDSTLEDLVRRVEALEAKKVE